MEGFRDADKECRNECLAVLSLIADSPSSHIAFYQTGLLNDLIYYACSVEAHEALQNDTDSDMGSPSKLAVWLSSHPQNQSKLRNFATPSELDLQVCCHGSLSFEPLFCFLSCPLVCLLDRWLYSHHSFSPIGKYLTHPLTPILTLLRTHLHTHAQFKRETWMLISDLLKGNDPSAMECVAQSPLLFALLAYVKYDTMASGLSILPRVTHPFSMLPTLSIHHHVNTQNPRTY